MAHPQPGLPPSALQPTAYVLTPLGSAFAIPIVFAARIDIAGYPLVTLTIDSSDGAPRITHVLEERRAHEDEVESRKRVPKARFKRYALAAAAVPREVERSFKGKQGLIGSVVYAKTCGSVLAEVLAELPVERRKRVADAELREDAAILRSAQAECDERPEREIPGSPSTKKRRAAAARKRGLLN